MATILNENKLKSIIRESINKMLNESTLNRIEEYIKNEECAIITAWRDTLQNVTKETFTPKHITHEKGHRGNKIVTDAMFNVGDKFSTEEKKFYNRELKAKLLKYGYGVTQVRGTYRESGIEGQEESLFVVNRNNDPNFKDVLFKLSEYYNQDSFLYSPKGTTEGYLIGTNTYDYPGYKNTVRSGQFRKNIQSMFMSRIGNKGFSFTDGKEIDKTDPDRFNKLDNGDNNYEIDKPMAFKDRKQERIKGLSNESIERLLRIETYEAASINGKHAICICARGL